MTVYFVKVHGDWLLLWSSILREGGARGDPSVHVCNCAMFIFFCVVLYKEVCECVFVVRQPVCIAHASICTWRHVEEHMHTCLGD